jgi:diketogulonate reductase-like aldo/keto reductase
MSLQLCSHAYYFAPGPQTPVCGGKNIFYRYIIFGTLTSCLQTVYNALKAGYRLLDGAGDYGNEKEAGEGLARAIKDGVVKREEVCK